MKRTATNSMVSTAKRCRKKFVWRYVYELVPARAARAPSFGTVFHRVVNTMLTAGLEVSFRPVVKQWRDELIEDAVRHSEQVKAMLGFEDDSLVSNTEERCDQIASEATELAAFYRDSVLYPERDRYRVLWAEQRFSVPLTTRSGKRHPWWRLDGKWDAVLQDLDSGRVVMRDFKTTIRKPTDFAALAELDTQPISYMYAGLYLCTMKRPEITRLETIRNGPPDIGPDEPFWPCDIGRPAGFELEVIRKKVPKEPPLLKKGGLSKSQNIDTTPELFRKAIDRHGLDPADYADVIDRLERRGPAFHYRSQVNLGAEEIARWAEETRMCIEDLRVLELHPERAYRADPMSCQSQYGRRCEYHALCYGDAQLAMADFVQREKNVELLPEVELEDF